MCPLMQICAVSYEAGMGGILIHIVANEARIWINT